MTDNEKIVAEIEARLEGITPGEWDTQHNETSIDIHCKENYALIASIPVLADNAEDNATFIAHAPADIRFLLSALKEAQGENERLREADAFTLIDYANLIDSKHKAVFVSFYFHGGEEVPRDERVDIFTQTCMVDTEIILDLVENDLENVIAKEHDYYCILQLNWDGDIWNIVEYHIENCTELNFPIQSSTKPKGDPNAN